MRQLFPLLLPTLTAAANGTKPNLVLFLQDDQDYALGGWTPMKKVQALLGDTGAVATNWFIHTPVCCPSRAEILSGRYFHNVRVPKPTLPPSGCMHADWQAVNEHTFGSVLGDAGYTVGYFGKHMNRIPSDGPPPGYSCPTCGWFANNGGEDVEPGGYLNATFSHYMGGVAIGPDAYHTEAGKYVANTNGEHAGYTTSLIGNFSIAWLKSVGPGDKPWMLTVASKACHVAAQPAPWYEKGTFIDALAAPRTPAYNASKEELSDHHWLIAQQDINPEEQGAEIDVLFRNRWRTLLSVDDAIEGVFNTIKDLGQTDKTYWLITSDHGYNLGQHRLPSCKLNVYDHDIRIPMLIAGPGIKAGPFSYIASNVDVAPTMLELAGLPVDPLMDGTSVAGLLVDPTHERTPAATSANLFAAAAARRKLSSQVVEEDTDPADAAPAMAWRDVHFIEYYSLGNLTRTEHLVDDDTSNTYRALRFLGNPTYGDFLYAEFTNLYAWNFTDTANFFYEAYNVSKDPDQLDNIYHTLPSAWKMNLAAQVQKQWRCKGREGPRACS